MLLVFPSQKDRDKFYDLVLQQPGMEWMTATYGCMFCAANSDLKDAYTSSHYTSSSSSAVNNEYN